MTIAFVKQQTGTNASASSVTFAYTSTAGNFLVIFVGANVTSITDSASQTWTKATVGDSGGASGHIECWYKANSAAITSVTMSYSSAQVWQWNISEWSGVDPTSPLINNSPNNSHTTSSTDCATPAVTTTTDSKTLTIAAFQCPLVTTATLNTAGFTALTNFDNTSSSGRAAYQLTTTLGTYSADWTLSPAESAGTITVSFKAQRKDASTYASMQAAIDSGEALIIPSGVTVNSSSQLLFDAAIDLQVDGTLQNNGYSNAAATTGGSFMVNRSFSTPVDNLFIHGSGYIRTIDWTMLGNLMGFLGANMTFSGFTISCWSGGRAMMVAGNNMTCTNLTMYGSPQVSGNGGLRLAGGNNFYASGCNIKSGDDALQFVPPASNTDPLYGISIDSGEYYNCTGQSYQGKFMVVALTGGSGIGMTQSITNCTFNNCSGVGGVCAVRILNNNSSGVVSNITFTNCTVNMDTSRAKPAATFLVSQATGTGGINGVHGNITITDPQDSTILSESGSPTNVDISIVVSYDYTERVTTQMTVG